MDRVLAAPLPLQHNCFQLAQKYLEMLPSRTCGREGILQPISRGDSIPPLEFQAFVFPDGREGESSMVNLGILKHFG